MMSQKFIMLLLGAVIIIGGGVAVYRNQGSMSDIDKDKQADTMHVDADMEKGKMSSSSAMEGKKEDGAIMGAGVVFKSGAIMLEEGKTMTPLTKDYMFKSGVKVMTNGKVMKVDGTSFMLKEGQSVWEDGSVIDSGAMMNKTDTMMKATGTMMKGDSITKDSMMIRAGSYEAYAFEKIAMKAKDGHVVLFFHASWCPTCRGFDNDVKAHLKDIPSTLTILDVDYDNSLDLKKKYGVTYQHTFVEVDANGTLIKKWSGSATLAALIPEIK